MIERNTPPQISVICPVLNEEDYIEGVLSFFLAAKPKNKELFIIDGGSIDKTTEIIKSYCKKYPFIHLLHNPNKYVPFALNLAIPKCKGSIIIRIDAHSDYSPDYFEQIIQTFEATQADIVGGPTRTRYKTAFQGAVATAICTPFGIGDSKVHQKSYEGFTDSVTFGAWHREIFSHTGLFDTALKRNQDDEFHYRARSKGFKVYQNPQIKVYYYPRKDIKSLFKQYLQYGLYKPLVLRKVKSGTKIRHLVPTSFVLYLVGLPFLILMHWGVLVPLGLYLLLNIYFSFKSEDTSWNIKVRILFIYPIIHFAYGIGFFLGLGKLISPKLQHP